ncbi:MAG: hypothetical protein U0574_11005 [Phycisphaerales bacterium]
MTVSTIALVVATAPAPAACAAGAGGDREAPLMIIGTVQSGPCFPEGYHGGLAAQCCQPPGPPDWKQLIFALGVPEEYTPVFEEVLTDVAARVEAVHKKHVPAILDADAPVREMRGSVDHSVLVGSRLEISRRLVPYLRALQSEEEAATRAIVALAQGLGFDLGDEQREKTPHQFEDARARVDGVALIGPPLVRV